MELITQARLYEWIKHPELLNKETLYELRTLLARYPYFQTARLLYLKNLYLLHDVAFGEEMRKASLFLSDRRVLFDLVEGEYYALKSAEPEKKPGELPGADRTLALIDSFLAAQPDEAVPESVSALIGSDIPVEAAADYASYLSHSTEEKVADETPKLKGQDLIDHFLEKQEEEPLVNEEEEEAVTPDLEEDELEDESYFTETLAKIYVKQQRYSKALEIIKKLNLKYPKKNTYFADQIRFLEKLIINTKSK